MTTDGAVQADPVPPGPGPDSAALGASCPKHMRHGPCGGVRTDLSCEVEPIPCPFAVDDVPVHWAGPDTGTPFRPVWSDATGPVVLTDLSLLPFDRAGLARTVGALAGTCDGMLVGEHNQRPDFPPTVLAALIRDAGGDPVVTLTCRDRNRVVLEQEVQGLREVGVEAVLCATGDARARGVRPDVTQVFDLDGTELAAMAAEAGLTVAVPESPDAPPRALRPGRVREKQRAGAHVVVLNLVGSAARLAEFAAATRAAGADIPLVAGVAVITDERSAAVLSAFPGLHLDRDRVRAVLEAPDPVEAGIAEAVAQARAACAVDGVVGVNLSGPATGAGVEQGAAIKAEIGRRLRDGVQRTGHA